MKVILIVVFSITIIKILPPLASVLRSPKVTGPGYRTSVLQLGPICIKSAVYSLSMLKQQTHIRTDGKAISIAKRFLNVTLIATNA